MANEPRIPGIRRLFRLPARSLERDVDEEVRFHIETRVEALIASGVSAAAARARALAEFGSVEDARRELAAIDRRRLGRVAWAARWEGLVQDVRHAARGLRREPGLAVAVVLTLALGIGANAVMFGVVDRLLLRGSAHVVAPERVRRVYWTTANEVTGELTASGAGYVSYALLRDMTGGPFEGAAAYTTHDALLGDGVEERPVRLGFVTWDLFPLLGVRPVLGRFFAAAEDRPGDARRVVVLDHAIWQSQFGGDSAMLGRDVRLRGEAYTVIGVAPPGFTGAELARVDLWVPMSVLGPDVTPDWTTTWDARWLRVVVRVRDGVTDARAAAAATAAHRAAYTGTWRDMALARVTVAPTYFSPQGGEPAEVRVSRWLVGVAAVVLIVACANVANLLLARAVRRRREIAVRLALGVSRRRLVRFLLAEALLLAAAGGAAALLLARWGGELMRRVLLPDVLWTSAPVDGRVLLVTAAIALSAGVATGLAPALQAGGAGLAAALRAGAREGGGRRARLRSALVVVQAALSVVLLVGAGLFVRSLRNVRALDLGLQPDRVLAVSPRWPRVSGVAVGAAERERARRDTAVDRAAAYLAGRPEYEAAGVAVGTPFQSTFGLDIRVAGWDSLPAMAGGGPFISAVSGGYLAAVGTRVLTGRGFTRADGAGSERVAMVSRTTARTLWPGREATGQCVYVDSAPCARVVGIVADAKRFQLREEPALQFYIPLGQERGMGGRLLLVRPRCPAGACDLGAAAEPLRRALRDARLGLPYLDVRPLQRAIDPQIRPWRLGTAMFGVFGALAFLVAAVGLYGALAYGVAQRRQEIGVRMALGARAAQVVRLVLGEGLRVTLLGAVVGAAAALVGGRFLAGLLFDVRPTDPAVFAAVVGLVVVVAAAASLVPAWRATRVDPAEVLRAD